MEESKYEPVTITSAEVMTYLESHNWQEFQAEGHFIGTQLPRHKDCPSCRHAATIHSPDDLDKHHAEDRVWCLNLYTPGTTPQSSKISAGLQCLRVQASTRDEAIEKMRGAILDAVYAHARQAYTQHIDWQQYHELKQKMDALATFVNGNLRQFDGTTAYEMAGRLLRQVFLSTKGSTELPTDTNEVLPISWRRS